MGHAATTATSAAGSTASAATAVRAGPRRATSYASIPYPNSAPDTLRTAGRLLGPSPSLPRRSSTGHLRPLEFLREDERDAPLRILIADDHLLMLAGVLDLQMRGLDELTCLDSLHVRYPNVHVVTFSAGANPEQIQSAFKRGACGYIVKSVALRDLGSAIRQSIDGTAYHALGLPALNEQTVAHEVGLTKRELEITKLLLLPDTGWNGTATNHRGRVGPPTRVRIWGDHIEDRSG